jgi:hypothetical protein
MSVATTITLVCDHCDYRSEPYGAVLVVGGYQHYGRLCQYVRPRPLPVGWMILRGDALCPTCAAIQPTST